MEVADLFSWDDLSHFLPPKRKLDIGRAFLAGSIGPPPCNEGRGIQFRYYLQRDGQFTANPSKDSGRKVYGFVREWLIDHLNSADRVIGGYMSYRKAIGKQ